MADFDLVYVINPRLPKPPQPGRVSRAWLQTHAEKGWVECDPSGIPLDDLSRKTKGQLAEIAAERGVPVPDGANKDEILAALTGQEG